MSFSLRLPRLTRAATPGGAAEVGAMAWPLAIGMLSFTIMGVVDTWIMGYVSTDAQAGVGLANTLVYGINAFFRGLTTGAQSLVAAADGAGDKGRVRRAGSAGVLVGFATGLAATLVLMLAAFFLLPFFVDDPAILASAHRYLGIRGFAPGLSLLAMGFMTGLLGLGDTRTRMWASVVGNSVNILGDLVFVFGFGPFPKMGEAGAGLATVLGTTAMALIYGARYLKRFGRPILPGWSVLKDSLWVGLPSGMQGFLSLTAFLVLSVCLARSGAEQLAASEIVLNIISLSFLPGYGVGEASGVLVGRYLGSGRPDLAGRTVRSARTLALMMMGACGLGFALGGSGLAGLFTQDPAVQAIAARLLIVAAAFQLLDAVATVHLCALKGAGDTRFTLLVTTIAAWGFTAPGALILGLWYNMGALGAWLGMTGEIAALALLTGLRVSGLASGRVGRLDLLLGRKRSAASPQLA